MKSNIQNSCSLPLNKHWFLTIVIYRKEQQWHWCIKGEETDLVKIKVGMILEKRRGNMFFNLMAFAGHPFFLLGFYPLLTLVSLFLYLLLLSQDWFFTLLCFVCLAFLVVGDQKAPFSIATTRGVGEGAAPLTGLLLLTLNT